jgi:phosphoribosylformylglycinamidine synthase
MAQAAASGLLRSAHDVGDGGLAVALAECCFRPQGDLGWGGTLRLSGELRSDILLFSETPSRMVVTTRQDAHLEEAARRSAVPCTRLGTVGGDRLRLDHESRTLVDLPLARLHESWLSLEAALS